MICTRFWIKYRISSKELRKEYKRKEYYDNIIKEYSTVIGRRNELNGDSKTAYRCKKDGVSKGIKALMSRWFIFQELNGVVITVLALCAGNQERLCYSLRS